MTENHITPTTLGPLYTTFRKGAQFLPDSAVFSSYSSKCASLLLHFIFQQVYNIAEDVIVKSLKCKKKALLQVLPCLHLIELVYLCFRNMMTATEQPMMTRDMNHMTTTTIIKDRSKFCYVFKI